MIQLISDVMGYRSRVRASVRALTKRSGVMDATLRQGNQIIGLILKQNDPREFAQNLISNWGAVQMIVRGEIDRVTLERVMNQIANPNSPERVKAHYFYPDGWKPTSVEEQLTVLREYYPNLDSSHVLSLAEGLTIPDGADGLFVVPKISSVAAQLEINHPYSDRYWQLLGLTVLDYLSDELGLRSYHPGVLQGGGVRLRYYTEQALRFLEQKQEGDFLIFPAQMGRQWAGYSPINASRQMQDHEYGLPAWVVGNILLTNPSRLGEYKDLFIDCVGDECLHQSVDRGIRRCLSFFHADGRLYLGYRWFEDLADNTGAASCYLVPRKELGV